MRAFFVFLSVLLFPHMAYSATFTVLQNLSFGTLIPVTTSGSVSISLNGTITTSGTVMIAPSGTTYAAGQTRYTGTGLSAALDLVTVSALTPSVTLTNGAGGTVTVNNFTVTSGLFISLLTPSVNINVGGTMNFTSASTPGVYTGSVQIRGQSVLSPAVTVTVPIMLTLWQRLSVSQITKLNFGGIEVSTGNSTVRIAPQTGARTVTSGAGGVNLITAKPGTAGAINVVGNPNTAVTISLPASTTLTGPGTAMVVNNYVSYPAAGVTTLDASGNMALMVGADLKVNTSQAAGTYNGIYNVTINY